MDVIRLNRAEFSVAGPTGTSNSQETGPENICDEFGHFERLLWVVHNFTDSKGQSMHPGLPTPNVPASPKTDEPATRQSRR